MAAEDVIGTACPLGAGNALLQRQENEDDALLIASGKLPRVLFAEAIMQQLVEQTGVDRQLGRSRVGSGIGASMTLTTERIC